MIAHAFFDNKFSLLLANWLCRVLITWHVVSNDSSKYSDNSFFSISYFLLAYSNSMISARRINIANSSFVFRSTFFRCSLEELKFLSSGFSCFAYSCNLLNIFNNGGGMSSRNLFSNLSSCSLRPSVLWNFSLSFSVLLLWFLSDVSNDLQCFSCLWSKMRLSILVWSYNCFFPRIFPIVFFMRTITRTYLLERIISVYFLLLFVMIYIVSQELFDEPKCSQVYIFVLIFWWK